MVAFSSVFLLVTICLVLASPQITAAQANDDLISRLERAAAFIREDRVIEAEQQLASVLKSVSEQADALNLLGAIRAKQGKLDEAEDLFSRSIRSNRRLYGARMNLAQLYLLKRAPQKAISELKELLRLDPGNEEAIRTLAHTLLGQNRLDEFVQVLEQEKNAKLPLFLRVELGDVYLKKKNPDKAQACYEQALAEQRDYADALLGLAQVAQFRGDKELASSYLARARKSVPNSPDTLYRFALVALKAGSYEESNSALLQAVKLRPAEPDYFIALGTTWLKKPDLLEAERAFRRALELRPGDPEVEMYLGYTLLEQKRYPQARELLELSLRKNQNVPETYYYLGLIAQEDNEDARAIQYFKKVVELLPNYGPAYVGLGSSYLKLKDYPRAQVELELAVKLDPDEPKAHYQLAVLFARLKSPERAQEEMRIVEKLKNSAREKKRSGQTLPP